MAFPPIPPPDQPASPAERTVGVDRVYRPAAIVRFTVFLEDWANTDGDNVQREDLPAPTATTRANAAVVKAQAERTRRRATGETDIQADAATLRAQADLRRAQTGRDKVASTAPATAQRSDNTIRLQSIPIDMTLELNGFRIADKLQLTVPLVDFPILPEMQRATLVELYMGTVSAVDFAKPDAWLPLLARTNLMFRGYVDEFNSEAGETDLTVKLTCTSLEARLMVAKINPFTKARRVKDGQRISDFVRQIVSTIPEFSGALGDTIGVRMLPNVDPAKEPTIDRKLFLTTLQSAASRVAGGGGQQVQGDPAAGDLSPGADPGTGTPLMPAPAVGASQYSPWDVIVRACELCGVLPLYDPSIDPDSILIVPPQNLMETPQDGIHIPGGPSDKFSRDFRPLGSTTVRSEVRFLVWGHNIKTMKQSRKFGRQKAPAVRCVCYTPDATGKQRMLVARFPKTNRGVAPSAVGSQTKPGEAGHKSVEEVITRIMRGLRTQEQLEQVAIALYHQIARQEVTCKIETDDMASFIDPAVGSNHNDNPDMLKLRPGTPVRVRVARQQTDPSKGLVINELSELFERRANPSFLRKLLRENRSRQGLTSAADAKTLDDELGKLEAAFASARLTDWFFCRCVNHRFSKDDGYSAEMELVNFVEARNLTALSNADKTANDRLKKVKPTPKKTAREIAFEVSREALADLSKKGL